MRGSNVPADEAWLHPSTPLQHSLLCVTSCSDTRGSDGRCDSQQHPPYRPPADLQISFSIRLSPELWPCTPEVWPTAHSDLSPSSPVSQSSPTSGFLSSSLSLSSGEEQLLESRQSVTGLAHHVVSLLQ